MHLLFLDAKLAVLLPVVHVAVPGPVLDIPAMTAELNDKLQRLSCCAIFVTSTGGHQ
jgi:hypothetical protein